MLLSPVSALIYAVYLWCRRPIGSDKQCKQPPLLIGGMNSVLTLNDEMIRLVSFRAKGIPHTTLRVQELVYWWITRRWIIQCIVAPVTYQPAVVHEWELVISKHNSHKKLNLLSVDIILIKFMIQIDGLLHVGTWLIWVWWGRLGGSQYSIACPLSSKPGKAGPMSTPIRCAKVVDHLYPTWVISTGYRIRAGTGWVGTFSAY